jgi:transcriptional regulator with XRE-family HTH domain
MTLMQTMKQGQRPVGELLRDWREQRRLSQFRLAALADISTPQEAAGLRQIDHGWNEFQSRDHAASRFVIDRSGA